MFGPRKSGKQLLAVLWIISLISGRASSITVVSNITLVVSETNSTETVEQSSNGSSIIRTERSHDDGDGIMLEPRDTSLSPDDPHFHAYFDEDTVTNVTYQMGKTARLHCRIRQLGNRVVSWVRQIDLHILTVGTYTYTTDQRFTSIHIDNTDDWTLEIRELRKADAGVYECQISNEPKLSMGINLNVIVVEARILEGPSLYVKPGVAVNLTCVVTDIVGTAFVFWYHEGDVIDALKKTDGIRITTTLGHTTVSRLYIPAAKPTDSGNYTCAPSYSEAATIILSVLPDEKPAAMQHGPNQGFAIKPCAVLTLILIFVLMY